MTSLREWIPAIALQVALAAVLMGAAAGGGVADLERLLQTNVPGPVEQSVLVVRLSDGKPLFMRDPDKLLVPASVTKVVTSAVALAKFSPVRVFETPFYYTGKRTKDSITGDLFVVGSGDPFIVSELLWQLAADIRTMGITKIEGGLVIDNSLFDDENRDESRLSATDDSSNAYDAPVSAFGVNFNTYAVAIAPDLDAGRPAVVTLDPYPLHGLKIENGVRTAKSKGGHALSVRRLGFAKGTSVERVVATGSVPVDARITKLYRSVGNPVQAAGEYLRAFLKGAGIAVKGAVRAGRKPGEAVLLQAMHGYDMRRIVQGLNTFSNNFIADMVVKRLGASFPRLGVPEAPGSGSLANGIAVINDFLRQDVGVTSPFVIKNGSGLDTENRLSARQIIAVLAYMERHLELFPDFLASLPATGWDGTLKKRFHKGEGENHKGQFRAKTGTLTEPVTAVSLAGYFRHVKHGMVAFCILENGRAGLSQPAVESLRDRQDEALVAMLEAF